MTRVAAIGLGVGAGLFLAGCSSAASAPDPSPSFDAPVLEVAYGTSAIDIAVGQSVDFEVDPKAEAPTTAWKASSSAESVFQVVEPSDDLLTPETPGGVAKGPGQATVSLIPPGGGKPWTVRVTVQPPDVSPSP